MTVKELQKRNPPHSGELIIAHVEPLEPWPRYIEYNLIEVARETKKKIDERLGDRYHMTNEQKRTEAVMKCYSGWKDFVHPDNLDLMPNYEMLDNLVKIFDTYGLNLDVHGKAESMFKKGSYAKK